MGCPCAHSTSSIYETASSNVMVPTNTLHTSPRNPTVVVLNCVSHNMSDGCDGKDGEIRGKARYVWPSAVKAI